MSLDFYGQKANGDRIAFGYDSPKSLNLSNANGAALLRLLGLAGNDCSSGEVPLAIACKAVQKASATFDYIVDGYTRGSSDTKSPGRCRVISQGLDEYGLADRLERFATFLCDVTDEGATLIYWG